MVPHGKVEEKLHEAAGVTEQTFVVTGVKDEKKGEQLIVLHKLSDEQLKTCLRSSGRENVPIYGNHARIISFAWKLSLSWHRKTRFARDQENGGTGIRY